MGNSLEESDARVHHHAGLVAHVLNGLANIGKNTRARQTYAVE
jgi:hypothetical protein